MTVADRPAVPAAPPGPPEARSAVGNLVWSVSGEGVRLAGSFVAFLLLVRLFEPAELGLLVATTGLFATLFPFAGLGGSWLALRRVTTESWSPAEALAVANGMTLVGSVLFGLLALAVRPFLLPQMSWPLFLGVGVSEMVLLGLVETTLFAAQAQERLAAKAAAWSVYGLARAGAAAALFAFVDGPGLGLWISVNIGIGAVVWVVAQLMTVGGLARVRRPRWGDVAAGFPYSVGFGAERLLAATDNVLLVRLGHETDAGLYAAARRLLTVSIAPVLGALHAVSARLWRAGGGRPEGVVAARALAWRLAAVGAVYGVVTAVAWVVFGDVAARLIGPAYAEASAILPWLGLVPLLLVLEIFAATALTASGLHRHRVALTVGAGLVNVVLNLLWIPGSGWRGAVAASLVSSALYVVALWLALGWAASRWGRPGGEPL
jgi:O-antigen/teichoic acid export membrane protein